MFVQVIEGQVTDQHAVKDALDRWAVELGPGAEGWLGSTTGVTADGRLVSVVQFSSAAAARASSDRPEQGEWWANMSELFTGEVSFHDCSNVTTDVDEQPAQSGFVQVINGRTSNVDRARELFEENLPAMAAVRRDVTARLIAQHDGGDGTYTMVVYFTSEEAAREGERKPIPVQIERQMAELNSINDAPSAYYDLKDPWLQMPQSTGRQ